MKEPSVAEFITARIRLSRKPIRQLAQEIGFRNANFLSMIKRGRAKIPLNRVLAISEVLNISPQSLLFRCLQEYDPDLLETIQLCLPGAFLSDDDLQLIQTIKGKLAVLRARTPPP